MLYKYNWAVLRKRVENFMQHPKCGYTNQVGIALHTLFQKYCPREQSSSFSVQCKWQPVSNTIKLVARYQVFTHMAIGNLRLIVASLNIFTTLHAHPLGTMYPSSTVHMREVLICKTAQLAGASINYKQVLLHT